jgi:hypothetical protein
MERIAALLGADMLSPADLLEAWETATEDNDYDIPRPSRNDSRLANSERSYDGDSSNG